jgi:NTE family protein
MERKIGLILTGGGARAAYQVGALKAIAELQPRRARNPFSIICGTSSGALNAVTLAINASHFRTGVRHLLGIWRNSHVEEIYRTDPLGVINNSGRWFGGLLLGSLGMRILKPVSLLDNSPLTTFLEKNLPLEKIQDSIDDKALLALGITASGYGSGHSVTFYQGAENLKPWKRVRRLGVPARIEIKHLLASSAIPFLFPAVRINREYFGDGSMRQIAPISAALHLGANRVMMIGVGQTGVEHPRDNIGEYPSLAQIAGHALNSIFLDSMEVDLERVQRINRTINLIPKELQQRANLRHIEMLVLEPSQSIEKIAERYVKNLPWSIRLLLRVIGAMQSSGANLVSYLLFERNFCRALIELGYQDAMKHKQEILDFFGDKPEPVRDSYPQ